MGYGLTRLEGPAEEPFDLGVAKKHLRVWSDDEDALLEEILIPAARERAEIETGRQIINASWRLTLPAFPCGALLLPLGRVQTVESVSYVDEAGDDQVLDVDSWRLHADREPAEILPVEFWPATDYRRADAVTVLYTPGYGPAATSVPALLKMGMLFALGHYYENREEVVTGTIATALPKSAADIFEQFRVGDEFANYEVGW